MTTDQTLQQLIDGLQAALLSVQTIRKRLRELDEVDGQAAAAGFYRALTALSTLRERGLGKVE